MKRNRFGLLIFVVIVLFAAAFFIIKGSLVKVTSSSLGTEKTEAESTSGIIASVDGSTKTETEEATDTEEPQQSESSRPDNPPPTPGGNESYFDDALFIGDSRTIGLKDYAELGSATVFATRGLNVFRVFKESINTGDGGNKTLEELLSENNYSKIYIMLGMNEIGYEADAVIKKYGELVNRVREAQPDATVYLQANLHIVKKRSDSDEVYNNNKLNELNRRMAQLADGGKIVYIDANSLFDDADGALNEAYTVDDFHLKAKYYKQWGEWLVTK